MRWKSFLILLNSCFISLLCLSQTYIPVEKSSSVKFFINNFGISTEGSLGGIKGDIDFNPNKLKDASFDMSVDAESIFTKNRTRDNHLKSRDYFYVEKYPTIYIISKSITKASLKNQYWFEGELMIKDVTRQIKFEFTAEQDKTGYLFKADFKINRRDYFIGGSSLVLSNNVDVALSISTVKKTF
ncbi:MAG: YceI family protein [Bacteroidetes bacterium]|nr:YceI family protein [Bacteroidota bacterium]